MPHDERRRYFRINEVIGLSIQVLNDAQSEAHSAQGSNLLALISQQDQKIEKLLRQLEEDHPSVAELLGLLNQKLERVSQALSVERELIDRIAHRVQEVNLSACGLAFYHDESLRSGLHLQLELTLLHSKQKILSRAVVVSSEQADDEQGRYFTRVDFYGMSALAQENLIQFIVQSQAQQLKARAKR